MMNICICCLRKNSVFASKRPKLKGAKKGVQTLCSNPRPLKLVLALADLDRPPHVFQVNHADMVDVTVSSTPPKKKKELRTSAHKDCWKEIYKNTFPKFCLFLTLSRQSLGKKMVSGFRPPISNSIQPSFHVENLSGNLNNAFFHHFLGLSQSERPLNFHSFSRKKKHLRGFWQGSETNHAQAQIAWGKTTDTPGVRTGIQQ